MIKSFKCKHTLRLFKGENPKKFRVFSIQAERKLQMLDCATCIEDLKSPPGNRLEMLSGSRNGQYSIRVNSQYRICFLFQDGNAFQVEIVDYH